MSAMADAFAIQQASTAFAAYSCFPVPVLPSRLNSGPVDTKDITSSVGNGPPPKRPPRERPRQPVRRRGDLMVKLSCENPVQ